jgi:hypothetical protein
VEIRDVMPPSYTAVGLSNEKAVVVLGVAEGTIAPSKETGEEITAAWYTKEELRALLKSETFGSWSQAYAYMWSRGFKLTGGTPFLLEDPCKIESMRRHTHAASVFYATGSNWLLYRFA